MELDDITVQHDWAVVDEAGVLLCIRNAENSSIQNCSFTKSGGTGIKVDRHGQNILIANNTLAYLGRNAIVLAGRGPGYGDVNKNNAFNYNYIYDSFNHSSNDYAWYNDNDQMAADNIGNMINGVLSGGNDPDPAPLIVCFGGWAETDTPPTGVVLLKANVSINSSYCNDSECGHTTGNFIEVGTIYNGAGGMANFADYYAQSFKAICSGEIAGHPLPGYQEMKALLRSKIESFGGSILSCEVDLTAVVLDDKIVVYPNPTSSNVTVIRKRTSPTSYVLYNSSGQIILHKEVQSNFLNLNLTFMPNGLYILKIDNQIARLIKTSRSED